MMVGLFKTAFIDNGNVNLNVDARAQFHGGHTI
jgi:hypothetical protein